MLTQHDIAEIERIVEEKLDIKTKLLPSKEEFFKRMDVLSGQLVKIEESQTLHNGQHTEIHDHEEDTITRMEIVEKKLGIKPRVISAHHW